MNSDIGTDFISGIWGILFIFAVIISFFLFIKRTRNFRQKDHSAIDIDDTWSLPVVYKFRESSFENGQAKSLLIINEMTREGVSAHWKNIGPMKEENEYIFFIFVEKKDIFVAEQILKNLGLS